MKDGTRLTLGIGMGAAIYFFALMLVPSIGFIRDFTKSHGSWISPGEVTQVTFLFVSLLLMAVLGRKDRTRYGFNTASLGHVLKPVLIVALVTIAFIASNIILTMMSKPPSPGQEHPAMGGGLLKTVLSVLILASTAEEVFYRGLLQGFLDPLKERGFKFFKAHISLPNTVCALGFGLGHLCLLGRMNTRMVISIVIHTAITGFIAGYYREKSRSLIPAVAAHMAANVFGAIIPIIPAILMGLTS